MNTIRRVEVLNEIEVPETSKGKPKFFSIQFYTDSGELVFVNRAKVCGLRMNMKSARRRGIQPVDVSGNPIGHIYPLCIDNIREFNGQRVKI